MTCSPQRFLAPDRRTLSNSLPLLCDYYHRRCNTQQICRTLKNCWRKPTRRNHRLLAALRLSLGAATHPPNSKKRATCMFPLPMLSNWRSRSKTLGMPLSKLVNARSRLTRRMTRRTITGTQLKLTRRLIRSVRLDPVEFGLRLIRWDGDAQSL